MNLLQETVQAVVEDIKEKDHPIQHTRKNELVAESVQAEVEDIKEQDHPIQHTGKSELVAETYKQKSRTLRSRIAQFNIE